MPLRQVAFVAGGSGGRLQVDVELWRAVVDRHARHRAGHLLIVVRDAVDLSANQVRRAGNVLAEEHRVERVGEFVAGGDLPHLRDLIQHLAAVHRIERILILQLRDHELQKRIDVQAADRAIRVRGLAGRRRGRGDRGCGSLRHGLFNEGVRVGL